jgi:hypothetical protein
MSALPLKTNIHKRGSHVQGSSALNPILDQRHDNCGCPHDQRGSHRRRRQPLRCVANQFQRLDELIKAMGIGS